MSRISNDTRKAVYRRDGYQCAVCGDPRRLQIHHVVHRSQGGGDEQMNLVTLCPVCHALAHGMNLIGVDFTPADVEQAMVEYLSDLYADLGFRWPDGAVLDGFTRADWQEAVEEWTEAALHPWDGPP